MRPLHCLFAAAIGCAMLIPATAWAKCYGLKINAELHRGDVEHSTVELVTTGYLGIHDLCPVMLLTGDTILISIYWDGDNCHGGFWGSIAKDGVVTDTTSWAFPFYQTFKITASGDYRIRAGAVVIPGTPNFSSLDPEVRFTVVSEEDQNIHLGIRGLFLQGASNIGSGWGMRTDLWESDLVAQVEPYSDMGHVGGGTGNEVLPADARWPHTYFFIADWVRLELYADPELNSCAAAANAIVLNTGNVRSASHYGACIPFNAPPGAYYLRVVHRNHLPVTLGPLQLDRVGPYLNLSSTPVLGEDTRVTVGNILCLRAGNAKPDPGPQRISYVGSNNDRDAILQRLGGSNPLSIVSGYYNEDVNMDGVVKYTGTNNDRDVVLQAIGGVVPTAVVEE